MTMASLLMQCISPKASPFDSDNLSTNVHQMLGDSGIHIGQSMHVWRLITLDGITHYKIFMLL